MIIVYFINRKIKKRKKNLRPLIIILLIKNKIETEKEWVGGKKREIVEGGREKKREGDNYFFKIFCY